VVISRFIPLTSSGTDVATARELCGNCERTFRKRSNLENATEEDVLKAIRGDYDSRSPNKFWQSYGVTVWSKSE